MRQNTIADICLLVQRCVDGLKFSNVYAKGDGEMAKSLWLVRKKEKENTLDNQVVPEGTFALLLLPCKSFAALSLAWATVRLPPRQTFAQVTPRGPPPAFCIPNAAFTPNTINLSGNKITRKVSGRMGTDVTEAPQAAQQAQTVVPLRDYYGFLHHREHSSIYLNDRFMLPQPISNYCRVTSDGRTLL